MENRSIAKLIKWGLPWLISVSLLLVLIYKIKLPDFEFFPNTLKSGLFIVVLFLSVFNNTIISGLKYQYVIKILGYSIALKEAVLIKTGSIPIKAVFPFKSGEAIRAVYLKRNHDFSYQKGFLSIALGYFLSLSSLALIGLTGWLLYQRNWVYGLSGALLAGFIVLFFQKVDSKALILKILEKSTENGSIKPNSSLTISGTGGAAEISLVCNSNISVLSKEFISSLAGRLS